MKDLNVNEVSINGKVYVEKTAVNESAKEIDGMKYVIVRTYSAGVFAGYLEKKEGKEVTLRYARRIWKWAGAATLSQLCMDGTSDPSNCKFPREVDSVILTEAIEILLCSETARKSIGEVKVWKE